MAEKKRSTPSPIARLVNGSLVPGMLGASLCAPCAMAAEIEEIIVTEEATGRYRQNQSSLNKLTESLLNTPQSVTAITRDMLDDRAAMSLDDALRNVPGITLGAGEFSWQGNNPSIRGFSSRNDMYVDGMRDLGSYTRDPFNLESVEVLLGPSSMVFGRGSTGGVINQSTRKPVSDEIRSLHMNVGSADVRRVTADFNQPLDLGEQAAFRINALYHKSEVPGRDVTESERKGFAPSLAVDLGAATSLTLSYLKLQSDSIPDYGLPWIESEPADVARDNYYGFRDDWLDTDADIATVMVDHELNSIFTLNAALRVAQYDRSSRITEPQVDGSVTRNTPQDAVTVYRMMFSGDSTEDILQGQLNLRADFVTGQVSHTFLGGLEYASENSDPTFGFAGVTPFFDYDLPTPVTSLVNPGGVFNGDTAARLLSDTQSDTEAFFLLDTMHFGERWQVTLGLRHDRFKSDYSEQRLDENGVQQSAARYTTSDSATSYRAAVVYKPEELATLYLGWGTSFNPSSESVSFISSGRGLTTSNVFLDPEENESIEAGLKWELIAGWLTLDSAVFRITKDNARVSDPDNPGFNTLGGEQTVDGFSANLTGQVTPVFQLTTGLTILDGEQKNALNGTTQPIQNLAETTFNLWADWVPADRIRVGAGARYIDQRYATASKKVDDYRVMDAMASYLWSDNITIKLNLTNITDEYYIDQIHPWHVVPGPGAAAVFAINLDY